MFRNIKWIWCDNFTKITIDKKFFQYLKKNKVKICIVSPELVSMKREKEIKKLYFYLKKNDLIPDAVCTKKPSLWKNLII